MTTTTNLGLKKPSSNDPIDVADINHNSDAIDSFAGATNTALEGKQATLSQDQLAACNSGITAAIVQMIFGRGTAIAENTDIHTLTQPGAYYCPDSATAATLTNCPLSDAGFRLVVTELVTVDGTRLRHDLYPVGSAAAVSYAETLGKVTTTYPDGWRPWMKFTGESIPV